MAKLFPSRARRLFWSRRAPHGGQQAHRSVVMTIRKPTGASPFDFHCPVEILSPCFQPIRWLDRSKVPEERTSLRPILCGFYQEFPPPALPAGFTLQANDTEVAYIIISINTRIRTLISAGRSPWGRSIPTSSAHMIIPQICPRIIWIFLRAILVIV